MQPEIMKDLQTALDAAKSRYIAQNVQSKALHEEAVNVLPGGNTRTILHTDPFPIYMKYGKSYQVTSEDGITWVNMIEIDFYLADSGAAILTWPGSSRQLYMATPIQSFYLL